MRKRCLILSMSCNTEERYEMEESCIMNTWGKDAVSNDDFDFFFFKGGYKKNEIDYEHNTIKMTCGDEMYNTSEKMKLAHFLTKDLNYDYVLITNTSTYINVELIDKFINSGYPEKDAIYCRICFWHYDFFNEGFLPVIAGDFIMLEKENANKIIPKVCDIEDFQIGQGGSAYINDFAFSCVYFGENSFGYCFNHLYEMPHNTFSDCVSNRLDMWSSYLVKLKSYDNIVPNMVYIDGILKNSNNFKYIPSPRQIQKPCASNYRYE